MYDTLEVTSQGKFKINGNIVDRKDGYDATKTLASLDKEKESLIIQYKEYIELIKDGYKIAQKDFDQVTMRLRAIDDNSLLVVDGLEKSKKEALDLKESLASTFQKNTKDIELLQNKQEKHYVDKADVSEIVKLKKQNNDIATRLNNVYLNTFVGGIVLETKQDLVINKPPVAKRGRKKEITEPTMIVIKENIKNLIKKTFPFKNKQECLSRTKSLFMSRDQILEVIEKNGDLKQLLPSNYKKLSKELLCDYLFGKD